MKRALPVALWLWAGCVSLAAAQDAPRVELLTIEPGDALWSRFGHTAVRVRGDTEREDLVFSFGYAPFDDPAFVLAYLRGEAQFNVGVRSWPDMLRMYAQQNRSFVRQPLQLSPRREQALIDALVAYVLPENRSYTYAQLTDNCATRVRDLIDEASGGALRRMARGQEAGRYRDHTLRAAGDDLLLSFALDFIGGPNQDRSIDGWQALYLPQWLRQAVRVTRVDGRVLAPEEHVVFTRQGPEVTGDGQGTGRRAWLFACVLLALWLGLLPKGTGSRVSGGLMLAAGLWLGVWALVVDVLVLVSEVPDFAWNENVLLFWPTDFALCAHGLALLRRRALEPPRWLAWYALARVTFALVVLTLTWADVLPQDNAAFAMGVALVFWPLTPEWRR